MPKPRISWIAFGVLFIVITSENIFGKKIHLVKEKEEAVSAGKKDVIGNFDLKTYAKKIKPENCKNKKTKLQCAHLMGASGQNQCLVNFEYMMDKCKLACRFCSPFTKAKKHKIQKDCKDRHPRCNTWAKKGDCLHYVVFMMDVCRKSCSICGNDYPILSDNNEKCPYWGKTGFCSIKKNKMEKLCPYSCKKYARRHYTVKYAKPPKRSPPHPTHAPKPTKPTPQPTRPMTQDEKEDMKEAQEEFAEEEETRLKEKEEQRKQKDQDQITPLPEETKPDPAQDESDVAPIQAPPVAKTAISNAESAKKSVSTTIKKPVPIPAPLLSSFNPNTDVPSEYEGGTPP